MDRKRVLKRMIGTICIIGLLVIGYKCIISGHSMPIFSENAISEYRIVALGGEEQSILIRGKNKNNPILLYLHGGPGNPETSFVVPYQKKWEEQFTVVNWDQRGSGRSYNDAVDTLTLTTEQICSDAIELTHYLKKEFDVEKIYLVGHSYGTYVGMRCIESNPEDFHAYVGIGQVGNQQKNENYLICYAMEMAEKDGNTEALDELEELGELPYQKDDFGRKISLSRKWTTYYGGQIYDEKNGNRFIVESILRPEYNVFDLVKFLKADALYYTNTEKDQARFLVRGRGLYY